MKKIAIATGVLLAGSAFAYRASHPATRPTSPSSATILPALSQQSSPPVQIPTVFDYYDLKYALAVDVFNITGDYRVQVSNYIDPDRMSLQTDPIRVGSVNLEHSVAGVITNFPFTQAGSIWVANVPASYLVGGSLVDLKLQVWRQGSNLGDPADVAYEDIVDAAAIN